MGSSRLKSPQGRGKRRNDSTERLEGGLRKAKREKQPFRRVEGGGRMKCVSSLCLNG